MACGPFGTLRITDGTDSVNLFAVGSVFHITEWHPAVAPRKGVWRESSLSRGRQLAIATRGNTIETMTLEAAGLNADHLIREIQDLRRLLEKAVAYWTTDWQDEPVWIEAQGLGESNARYSLIHDYRLSPEDFPYGEPFWSVLGKAGMSDFDLILEREDSWRADEPGTGTCIEIIGAGVGSVEMIRRPTQTWDDAYVGPAAVIANNTHLLMGNGAVGAIYHTGVRFRSVTLPPGSRILSAFIRFTASAVQAGTPLDLTIVGEDNSTPAVFSTYADFMGRLRTTNTVAWDGVAGWGAAGVTHDTPDISAIVEEIVNRADWTNGNNMTIFVEDNGPPVANRRDAASWDNGTYAEPELHIIALAPLGDTTASCDADRYYVASKRNYAQITNVHFWNGAAWSGNLIGAGVPFAFLPNPVNQDHVVVFGIDTSLADSGPFCSLVFDISTAMIGVTNADFEWRYSDVGVSPIANWTALVVQDNTHGDGAMGGGGSAFDTLWINSVHWEQPSGWDERNPTIGGVALGVTGFWVAVVITGVVAGTPPSQDNRDIYSVIWPHVEIQADEVLGDVPVVLQIQCKNQSGNPAGAPDMRANRVIMGLRSYDRGNDFAAYLNMANEQNPPGLTVTAPDAVSNLEADETTSTGRRIRWQSPGASGTDEIARLAFNSALIPNYYGQYHVFLRGQRASGVIADIDVYLQYSIVTPIGTNVAVTQSEIVQFQSTTPWEVLDFGKLQIPGATLPLSEGVYEYWIQVIGENTTAATAIDVLLFDLILIPVDEWAADYKDSWTSGSTGWIERDYYLDADGITYPKRPKRAVVKTDADLVCDIWVAITPQPPMLQANTRQRLWFFTVRNPGVWSEPYHGHTIQMWKNQRYLSMRGNR